MNTRRIWLAGAAVVIAALVWFFWGISGGGPDDPNAPPKSTTPLVGSAGTFFGPTAESRQPTPVVDAKVLADAQSEVDRLWPHVRKGEPTEAERAKIRVQWVNFSVKYPSNVYIPNEFKPPLTAAEQKTVRQQLDDTTALAAKQASQKHADKFAMPPSQASIGDMAQTRLGTPAEMTEQQARDSGITPAQQRNYFNYKIKELESRIQLVEFYLSSDDLGATKKAAAQKELIVWKKELEELTQTRAQVPNS